MSTSLAGVLAALSAGLFGGIMGACVKHAAADFASADMLIFRMFWSALILLPWCFHRVIYAFQKDSKMMWVRAIFGSLGAICYFHSLKYTSVSMAVLLWSASPVFVILISVVFLGERLSWRQIFGAITVMIGIFALKFGDYTSISLSVLTVGFAGAFFAACAYTSLKRVPLHFDPILVVFMLSACSCVVALPFSSQALTTILTVGRLDLWGIAAANMIMQYSLTVAYRKIDASVAVLITQTTLVWAALFDHYAFGVAIGWYEVSLFIVIVMGIVLVQKRLPSNISA